MLGDGIVSFGVPVVATDRRKAKSSPKIVSPRAILPSTRSAPWAETTVCPSGRVKSTAWPAGARLTPSRP